MRFRPGPLPVPTWNRSPILIRFDDASGLKRFKVLVVGLAPHGNDPCWAWEGLNSKERLTGWKYINDTTPNQPTLVEAARGLVAWCDEFVGEVQDHNGVSLVASGEWADVLGDLRAALPETRA